MEDSFVYRILPKVGTSSPWAPRRIAAAPHRPRRHRLEAFKLPEQGKKEEEVLPQDLPRGLGTPFVQVKLVAAARQGNAVKIDSSRRGRRRGRILPPVGLGQQCLGRVERDGPGQHRVRRDRVRRTLRRIDKVQRKELPVEENLVGVDQDMGIAVRGNEIEPGGVRPPYGEQFGVDVDEGVAVEGAAEGVFRVVGRGLLLAQPAMGEALDG
ncbi:hypothetical protein HPP92_023637 [Vanilla planifolia]|uniref:Uncharacterized protein n=1 Tax=Vanilla planifolia TaxID=51239 RepID=A0A835PQE9_VANPL|nr:hypothetical protein HPP92_023637 [Vanilla planifolia]